MYKLGVSNIECFDGRMEFFCKNGINYMEFRVIKGDNRPLIQSYTDKILAEKKKIGYEIRTVHLPQLFTYDLSQTDDFARLKAIQNQKEIVNMLLPLGAKIAVLHPDAGVVEEKDYLKRHKALIKSLKEFAPWCRERGLKIAIENLTQISAFQTSSDLMEIVDAVGDNVGICFDVNHNFKETHKGFIKNAGKHIITMHISDNDGKNEKHHFPGMGVINFKEIVGLMNDISYDSTFIFECARAVEADDPKESSKRLLKAWNNAIK
ncbi:MAG: sugar phosphate isomerase/epimerase [Clostridia bacterium]|nr:sugar phosphate isomerase/epimerase [Clostridia bacterium]